MDYHSKKDMEDIDDDPVELPPDTALILQEFLLNKIQQESNQNHIEEDWQLSQFWYNDDTKEALSKVCSKLIEKHTQWTALEDIKIALLSCPSLYKSVKSIHPNGTVRIFEFDNRFAVHGDDFVSYDYKDIDNAALSAFSNYFDIIIADPPFLSRECMENTSNLIKRFRKDKTDIVVCSGQTVETWVQEFLGLNQCKYRPEHERNLANEFCSYANFDLDSML